MYFEGINFGDELINGKMEVDTYDEPIGTYIDADDAIRLIHHLEKTFDLIVD